MSSKPLPLTPQRSNKPLPLTPPQKELREKIRDYAQSAAEPFAGAVNNFAVQRAGLDDKLPDSLEDGATAIIEFLEDKHLEKKFEDLGSNHHFIENGIEGKSPVTERNLEMRKYKSRMGTAFSVAGTFGSTATGGVNVAKITKQGAATASSSLHLYKLRHMAEKVRQGGSLRRHLDLLIFLKGVKAAHRGQQLITSAIPDGGITAWLVDTACSLGNTAFLDHYARAIIKTAEDLHWQARQGLVIIGSTPS
jgi:hypothetical protein